MNYKLVQLAFARRAVNHGPGVAGVCATVVLCFRQRSGDCARYGGGRVGHAPKISPLALDDGGIFAKRADPGHPRLYRKSEDQGVLRSSLGLTNLGLNKKPGRHCKL